MTCTPNANASRPEPSVWDRFHPGAAGAPPAAPAAPALNRFAEAMFTLGARAFLAGRPAETDILLRLSIGAGGNDFAALGVLGLIAMEREDFPAAEGWLRAALAINPDYAEAHDNLGCALRMAGRPAEALARHQRAVALKRDFSLAHDRLRVALVDLNRHEEALVALRNAAAWDNDLAKLRLNEAQALLALGRFPLGWKAYEARWDVLVDGVAPIARRHADHPRWPGNRRHAASRLAGQTLLLHAEQGFGDTLQFCRYAPMLAQQGARVIVEVQPPLVPLLRSLRGVAQVIAMDAAPPAFDLQCPLLSLPLACGTTLATVPAEVPYLAPSPDRVAAWRRRLGRRRTGRRRVGLAWSGNPGHANDRTRSIPFGQLQTLLARADCEFHIAQPSILPTERPLLDGLPQVKDHCTALTDFADTAALLSLMDLVISVDTAVTHVAGALARPTWLLLPFSAEWRWLTARADSPWYPTLRLFRQPGPGDWDSVLAAVARALDP